MLIQVSIANEQSSLAVDEAKIREIVAETLHAEEIENAEISVALVDDPTMHELNRRHLEHDYPTDVLSFLLADSGDEGEPLEGEIIISTETAIRQAAEYTWAPEAEFTLYLVHGLLHLCGYDDHTAADRRRMRSRERAILKIWGLSPHYAG